MAVDKNIAGIGEATSEGVRFRGTKTTTEEPLFGTEEPLFANVAEQPSLGGENFDIEDPKNKSSDCLLDEFEISSQHHGNSEDGDHHSNHDHVQAGGDDDEEDDGLFVELKNMSTSAGPRENKWTLLSFLVVALYGILAVHGVLFDPVVNAAIFFGLFFLSVCYWRGVSDSLMMVFACSWASFVLELVIRSHSEAGHSQRVLETFRQYHNATVEQYLNATVEQYHNATGWDKVSVLTLVKDILGCLSTMFGVKAGHDVAIYSKKKKKEKDDPPVVDGPRLTVRKESGGTQPSGDSAEEKDDPPVVDEPPLTVRKEGGGTQP